jgi:hypothetical protein
MDESQLASKFNHAPDFGVTESPGESGYKAFGKALQSFVDDSDTIRTLGSYRGNSAILNYNLSIPPLAGYLE